MLCSYINNIYKKHINPALLDDELIYDIRLHVKFDQIWKTLTHKYITSYNGDVLYISGDDILFTRDLDNDLFFSEKVFYTLKRLASKNNHFDFLDTLDYICRIYFNNHSIETYLIDNFRLNSYKIYDNNIKKQNLIKYDPSNKI
jgi:hypothetical protein